MFNSWSSLSHTLMAGSLGYVIIVFLLRISGKRTLAKWNSFDFVVTIAFGSILAAMLLSKDTSLIQATLGFGILVLCQFIISWIAARSPLVQHLIKAKPALLLYQGQVRHTVLKKERVSEGEVLAAIRSQGIGDMTQVGAVVLETNGSFSVIKKIENASALKDVRGVGI